MITLIASQVKKAEKRETLRKKDSCKWLKDWVSFMHQIIHFCRKMRCPTRLTRLCSNFLSEATHLSGHQVNLRLSSH